MDVPASSGTGLPSNDSAMLMLSPNSEQDREEDDENEDNEDEHYEDAQQGEDIDDRAIDERCDRDRSTDMTSLQKANAQTPRRWRRRVEDALARLTVEVSALREQSRTEYDQRDSGNITIPRRLLWIFSIGTSGRRRGASIWKWVVGRIWALLRHVVIDLVLVGLLYAWMRRRRDERSQMITGIVKGIIMEQGRRLQARLGRQQQR
ncbi:MAG: hypothetical protein M1815_004724 [Lichina confinis]|nr:MAG: hypothetical protein M1815_004724 [Lichina confinis]